MLDAKDPDANHRPLKLESQADVSLVCRPLKASPKPTSSAEMEVQQRASPNVSLQEAQSALHCVIGFLKQQPESEILSEFDISTMEQLEQKMKTRSPS